RSCDFEKRRVRVPIRDEIAYHRQAVGNCVLRNHFSIYVNPFAKRDEVRGYEQASAIALRPTDGIDHGANGALAVCAGDVDDLECKGVRRGDRRAFDTNAATTFVEQASDVFETQFDPEALETIQPGERLFVIQTRA